MSRDSTTTPPQTSDAADEERRYPTEERTRPTRTSAILGALTAVGIVGLVVLASGGPAAAVAALAGLSTAGVLLFATAQRHRIAKRVCASVLLFVSGLLLLGCVALTVQPIFAFLDANVRVAPLSYLGRPTVVGRLLVIAGVGTAIGGAAVAGRDAVRFGDYTSTVAVGLSAIGLPLVGVAVVGALALAGVDVDPGVLAATAADILLGTAIDQPINYLGLAVAWGLVYAAITAVRAGVRRLPIAELAPPPRREDVADSIERVQSGLSTLRFAIGASPVGILLIEAVRSNDAVGLTDAYLRVLSTLATATGLRLVLLEGIVAGAVAVALGGGTQRLARGDPRRTALRAIPVLTGLAFAAVLLQFSSAIVELLVSGPLAAYRPTVSELLSEYSLVTLVGAASVVVGGAPIGVYCGVLLIDSALLPDRADGAALLSVGLFVSAVGVLLQGGSTLLGFVGIAGSLLAWDLATNAVSLGREIGRGAPTRQAELVHAGASLGVAALGVVVATAGLSLVRGVPSPPETLTPVVAVVSVIGLFVLLFSLRGS